MPQSTSPDKQWAWMIVLASFSIQFLTIGQVKSYGILMIELMAVFGHGVTITGWVGGLAQGLAFGLAPVTCILVNRFKHRRVVIAGGLIAGIGMSLGFLAQSLAFIFLTYGVLFGIGVGLVQNPALTMFGLFFRKNFSFASSLIRVGSGLGAFTFPLILNALLRAYNLQSVFLICGGLVLNCVIAGFLMRPPAIEKKEIKQTELNKPTSESANVVSDTRMRNNSHLEEETKEKTHSVEDNVPVKSTTLEEKATVRQLFYWQLLLDPYFLVYSIARMIFIFASLNTYILLALKVQELERGGDEQREAVFVSFLSICEIIGRFVWGKLLDHGPFRSPVVRIYFLAFLMLCGALNMVAIGLITTLRALASLVPTMGLLLAGGQAPAMPILSDLLGSDRIGDGMGVIMLGQAAVLTGGPLITGAIVDNTGSVTGAFITMGLSWSISSVLTVVLRIMNFFNVKNSPTLQHTDDLPDESTHYKHLDTLHRIDTEPDLKAYTMMTEF